MAFEAVIFDLDGVITDTAKVHALAWKRLFDEYLTTINSPCKLFDIDIDYLNYVDGKPRYEGVASFLKSRNISIPFGNYSEEPNYNTVCGLGNQKDRIFNLILDKEGVGIFESTIILIRELLINGVKCGVASSSKNCKKILNIIGIEDLFEIRVDGVVSVSLNLKGKPFPDIFLKCAELMKVSNLKTIIVEDAVSGVQAGRAGEFGLVIGIGRGDNSIELKNNGADIVVKDLCELSVLKINELFVKHNIGNRK